MPACHPPSPGDRPPTATDSHLTDFRPSPLAALLSGLIPGLGQLVRRRTATGLLSLLVSLVLLGLSIALGHHAGTGAEVFMLMLIVLPWWTFQAYDAYRATTSRSIVFIDTWKAVWSRGHDVRYLGALFLLSAGMDLYIILKQPEYALAVFCTKPTGLIGILVKAQSPTVHTLLGVGFLRLRRWALLLYLAYAGFGLLNGTVNFACFGFGRVRTIFLVSLVGFTAYVLWRRRTFG